MSIHLDPKQLNSAAQKLKEDFDLNRLSKCRAILDQCDALLKSVDALLSSSSSHYNHFDRESLSNTSRLLVSLRKGASFTYWSQNCSEVSSLFDPAIRSNVNPVIASFHHEFKLRKSNLQARVRSKLSSSSLWKTILGEFNTFANSSLMIKYANSSYDVNNSATTFSLLQGTAPYGTYENCLSTLYILCELSFNQLKECNDGGSLDTMLSRAFDMCMDASHILQLDDLYESQLIYISWLLDLSLSFSSPMSSAHSHADTSNENMNKVHTKAIQLLTSFDFHKLTSIPFFRVFVSDVVLTLIVFNNGNMAINLLNSIDHQMCCLNEKSLSASSHRDIMNDLNLLYALALLENERYDEVFQMGEAGGGTNGVKTMNNSSVSSMIYDMCFSKLWVKQQYWHLFSCGLSHAKAFEAFLFRTVSESEQSLNDGKSSSSHYKESGSSDTTADIAVDLLIMFYIEKQQLFDAMALHQAFINKRRPNLQKSNDLANKILVREGMIENAMSAYLPPKVFAMYREFGITAASKEFNWKFALSPFDPSSYHQLMGRNSGETSENNFDLNNSMQGVDDDQNDFENENDNDGSSLSSTLGMQDDGQKLRSGGSSNMKNGSFERTSAKISFPQPANTSSSTSFLKTDRAAVAIVGGGGGGGNSSNDVFSGISKRTSRISSQQPTRSQPNNSNDVFSGIDKRTSRFRRQPSETAQLQSPPSNQKQQYVLLKAQSPVPTSSQLAHRTRRESSATSQTSVLQASSNDGNGSGGDFFAGIPGRVGPLTRSRARRSQQK